MKKYLSLKLISGFLKHKKGLCRYVCKVTKEHLYKRYKIWINLDTAKSLAETLIWLGVTWVPTVFCAPQRF